MAKQPHLYRKLMKLAKQIADYDIKLEVQRKDLNVLLPRRFRLTSDDVDIALREIEDQKLIERIEKRRIRLPRR